MKQRIYLDNNASTLLDPRVLDAVVRNLHESYGNPSSTHSYGQKARQQLNYSRELISSFFKVLPQEIIFTSGATEALNTLIRGTLACQPLGHVISSNLEHASVYFPLKAVQEQVTFLSPGLKGAPQVMEVERAIRPDTKLIVLMAANNETGVKIDLHGIAALAHERKISLIIDGVALLGKESFHIPNGVSAMCFSGHKIHAPKGVGMAFIRKSFKTSPLLLGGEQEFHRRGGTENLSGIVGLAEAIKILREEQSSFISEMERLRNQLEQGILSSLPDVFVNGLGTRTTNTTNLAFAGVDGESLLIALDWEGIAISHGSACASGGLEPSRILVNMGIPLELARSSIRFSLSRFTTIEEIEICIETVVKIVKRLRNLKP